MAIELITFDAGNTLIYADPPVTQIYSDVSRELGANVAPEVFERNFLAAYRKHAGELPLEGGRRDDAQDRNLWKRITRELFDSVPELAGSVGFEDWFNRLYEIFGSSRTWRYFEDAEETLCELKYAGYKLGLISNWDTRLRRIAKEMRMLNYMHAVAISSEVGFRKPHPNIFETVREYIDVPPEQALHVGDLEEEDVEGARRAGWKALLLDRKDEREPPGEAAKIRSLTEIWDYLE